MNSGPAILQFRPTASTHDTKACVDPFGGYGHAVTVCTSLTELTRHIRGMSARPDARILAIIDGRQADHAMVVSTLRALRARLGIMALVNRNDDDLMIRLLHMGVDTCGYADAPDLLVATALRLLWRLDVQQYDDSGAAYKRLALPDVVGAPSGSWQLIDQGWSLSTPRGDHVALTTGERAFLMALFGAPSQKASHNVLIAAVNASYRHTGHVHQSRLGVMVSRLRRKFKQAGAPLPLKSVHNWGYMFVNDV